MFPNPSVHYRILSLQSGQVLDLSHGIVKSKNFAIQWNWNNQPNQVWSFVIEQGYYRLSAVKAEKDPLVLSVSNGSTADGAEIILYPPHPDALDQFWSVVADPSGCAFSIVNRKSRMCMAVQNGSLAPATRIVQNPCTGSWGQKWIATEVTGLDGTAAEFEPAASLAAIEESISRSVPDPDLGELVGRSIRLLEREPLPDEVKAAVASRVGDIMNELGGPAPEPHLIRGWLNKIAAVCRPVSDDLRADRRVQNALG